MSAITGVYHPDGETVDRMIIDGMTATLAHRGSDGSGAWCEGPVGLGHVLSWTTPESLQESLPWANRSGDFVITADARLDNREELFRLLDLDGPARNETTDSQLIVAAYEKWGESCPERLLGDFAFAIWDNRRRVLFCARDHVGVKPFYYFLSDRVFALASEIKALLRVEGVPSDLNEGRVADHLLSNFDDTVGTFYRDILRLAPAHTLTVGNGTQRLRCYWTLDEEREAEPASDEEYAEAFRGIFTAAVQCRLRSAFPVGSTLSGGLDSSSIVCTARNLLQGDFDRRLHTYSAIFPGLPEEDQRKIDERKYMDSVLSKGGLEPHFVRADKVGPLADLDRVLWHNDGPPLAPNLYIHRAMYAAARQDSVRVLLDGFDGDTTVSHGLDRLSELAHRGSFLTMFREASQLSGKVPGRNSTPMNIAWQYGLRDLVPKSVEGALRRLLGRRRKETSLPDVINPSFAERAHLAERMLAENANESRRRKTTREHHYESLTSPLIPYTLELADKASAAFGLEARYPFFDRRLIEFCLALPADQKLKDGWTRSVLRRAMTGILPPQVQWRIGKANLSPAFRHGLLDFGGPTIEEVIEDETDVMARYIDMPVLRASYRRYAADPSHSDQDAMTVYNAVMLGVWLRNLGFDGRAEIRHGLVGPPACAGASTILDGTPARVHSRSQQV